MDGIVDSCARMVEVDGRFEIELIEQKQSQRVTAIVEREQKQSLESYSNR